MYCVAYVGEPERKRILFKKSNYLNVSNENSILPVYNSRDVRKLIVKKETNGRGRMNKKKIIFYDDLCIGERRMTIKLTVFDDRVISL